MQYLRHWTETVYWVWFEKNILAAFITAFNNANPTINQITQNFFALNGNIVQATLGGIQTINKKDIKSFRSYIPMNIALGINTY